MSRKKIKAFDFSNEINAMFITYGQVVNQVIDDAMKATCEQAVSELKAVQSFSPNGHPSGKYSADWTYEIKPIRRYTRQAKVYNEDHYRLTHLLENGHALVRGGRKVGNVKGFEHIAPVNEKAHEQIINEIINRVTDYETL